MIQPTYHVSEVYKLNTHMFCSTTHFIQATVVVIHIHAIHFHLLFSLLINILNSCVLSIEKKLSLPFNEAHIILLQLVPARII